MANFKCKMCGAELTFDPQLTVCECEYCGSKQTIPQLDNEKKINLFTRANRLRFNNEFDKAAGIYESIIAEFPEEAEAYWGLILCKYGIEYVDDPATAKKVPTCHRSSFDSVMDDTNFDMVMEYSDAIAKRVYREEAKQIEEIRKGIVEVSSKEEPYDIFICYKETDENGDRTIDSVIAQDVYTELTEKGYRVFFSRITLEDKLGVEYEPYIFAALHSAKVMLAFGTDYEYYNAVWVKNEWSRYLSLIAKGEKKTLIPCYKGIDPYDMPKEFAHLQAQDMGKVGAFQDLVRGVDKIFEKTAKVSTVAVTMESNIDKLLATAFDYIENSDWERAEITLNSVIMAAPENAQAYLGKLLVENKIQRKENLKELTRTFDGSDNYKKLTVFGDNVLKTEINRYLENVKDEIKKKKQQDNKKIIKIVTMCSTALITVLLAVFVITPSIKFSAEIKKIADSNIGDTVSFGKYPQSNANKKEPVEWVILDKQGDKYLLMTINGLDSVEYKKYAGYWSDSNLRNWLNNDFYNSAFSDKEKSLISMTTISDDKQGGASQDYVFALSVQEFKQYNAPEKVKITEYADSHSAYSVSENNRGMFSYWLRTVLSSSTPTSVATSTNIVNGDITNNKNVLVAPVIWVNIK